MEQSQPSTVALREFRLKCEIEIYKSFNKSVCKNASGTRGMCQRMNTVTMVAMNKHELLRERERERKKSPKIANMAMSTTFAVIFDVRLLRCNANK